MLNIKELRKNVNLVNAGYISLKRKEAKALAQYLGTDEKPMLLCRSAEDKIVLTRENLFIITSRLFRIPKVKVIPLSSIKNIQEKRGLLLARIDLIMNNSAMKIRSLDKKAPSIIMNSLKYSENIEVLPVKTPGILEIIYKIAITLLFAFILKDMLSGGTKSEISHQPQSVQEETSTIATPSNGETTISMNTGKVTQKKSTTKQWFEGGTLHNATLEQWRKATPENKLATCADFMAGTWKDNKLKPHIANMNELKYYAQELVTFIDTCTEGIEHYKINEIAGTKNMMIRLQVMSSIKIK